MRKLLGRLLLLLLCAHILLGLLRIPHAVIGHRRDETAALEARGRVRYLLDRKHWQGASTIQWILDNTVEDSVFLWRGQYKGSFELVAELIFPRLLYHESLVPRHTQELFGRPVAARVIVGLGNDLELRQR
jgi:hypothetical protein